MEYFENKVVCGFNTTDNQENQDDFCSNSLCENDDVDCGECIFSERFCDKSIFDRWLIEYKQRKKEDDE